MQVEWIEGLPPDNPNGIRGDLKSYLFYSSYTCVVWYGRKRYRSHYEPHSLEYSYRGDCCGRFTNPTHYAEINVPERKKR